MKNIPSQTRLEEIFNSLSHAIAALAAIGGLVLLIVSGAIHPAGWSLFSSIIYGLCLISLFASSAIYHYTQNIYIKEKLRIMDHSGIFLMIAGTYTPVLLLTIGGKSGWVFFFLQWILALAGILLKLFFTGRFETISLLIYLAMGWIGLLKIDVLYTKLPITGFWYLILGGLAYTLGILFYIADHRIRFSHFIWHLFVVKGSILHFLLILLYVLEF